MHSIYALPVPRHSILVGSPLHLFHLKCCEDYQVAEILEDQDYETKMNLKRHFNSK